MKKIHVTALLLAHISLLAFGMKNGTNPDANKSCICLDKDSEHFDLFPEKSQQKDLNDLLEQKPAYYLQFVQGFGMHKESDELKKSSLPSSHFLNVETDGLTSEEFATYNDAFVQSFDPQSNRLPLSPEAQAALTIPIMIKRVPAITLSTEERQKLATLSPIYPREKQQPAINTSPNAQQLAAKSISIGTIIKQKRLQKKQTKENEKAAQPIITKQAPQTQREIMQVQLHCKQKLMKDYNVRSEKTLKTKLSEKCDDQKKYRLRGNVFDYTWTYYQDTNELEIYTDAYSSSSSSYSSLSNDGDNASDSYSSLSNDGDNASSSTEWETYTPFEPTSPDSKGRSRYK